ncbi:LamG domain-containing protein [Kitasatospora camelliae]|uniref:LamG-like jellyroll fold domain-containing protein n=1 Tax=Kitasatospora camelliae TaxID=3156397 RepID=A0AAU8JZN3_9ACTN
MTDGGGITGASGTGPVGTGGQTAGQGDPGGWGGTPAYLPPVTSAGPDWAAMADANEAEHRRKKLMKIGGAVLGVAVAGALVATAVAVSRPGGDPEAKASASAPVNPDGPAVAATGSATPAPSTSGTPAESPSATPTDGASGPPKPTKGTTKPAAGATGPGPGGAAPAAGLPGLSLGNGAAVGTTEGHTGPTLNLRGSGDGYAQSGAPLVDTSKSFTVSAVVRNNAPTGGRAVVTQGTGSYYSFYLGRDYWDTHNQWVFKVQTAAGDQDTTTRQAFSTAPATTGQWTVLTGVYDAGTQKIQLYVNGALQQTTSIPGIWQTSGALQIGRTRWKSQWTDYWDGAIADVQVWNQALPGAAVAQLGSSGGVSAGAAPAHSWLLP